MHTENSVQEPVQMQGDLDVQEPHEGNLFPTVDVLGPGLVSCHVTSSLFVECPCRLQFPLWVLILAEAICVLSSTIPCNHPGQYPHVVFCPSTPVKDPICTHPHPQEPKVSSTKPGPQLTYHDCRYLRSILDGFRSQCVPKPCVEAAAV